MPGTEFNEFNNTGTRMLDSINHMTLKLLNVAKQLFWRENVKILPYFAERSNGRHSLTLLNL